MRHAEAMALVENTKLCPDEQLACFYDHWSPVVIEVACSQEFYGVKWKLDEEVIIG
jgi:hypothetical protein